MSEMRSLEKRLAAIALVAIALVATLGLTGCDLSPKYPVLDGNGGRSSLSPTDEAALPSAEAAPAQDQTDMATAPVNEPDAAVSAEHGAPTEVRGDDDAE